VRKDNSVNIKWWGWVSLSALVMVAGDGVWAFAQETGGPAGWRPVYDNVMLVVNFLILAFLLTKLLKNPLKNFLKTRHDEVAHELERLETERERAAADMADTKKLIAAEDTHILEIRERIIAEGERTRQAIIENAKKESDFLIEAARRRIQGRFREARQAFRAELIESAMSIVARRLPEAIGPQDQARQVDLFFTSLDRAQGKLSSARSASR